MKNKKEKGKCCMKSLVEFSERDRWLTEKRLHGIQGLG